MVLGERARARPRKKKWEEKIHPGNNSAAASTSHCRNTQRSLHSVSRRGSPLVDFFSILLVLFSFYYRKIFSSSSSSSSCNIICWDFFQACKLAVITFQFAIFDVHPDDCVFTSWVFLLYSHAPLNACVWNFMINFWDWKYFMNLLRDNLCLCTRNNLIGWHFFHFKSYEWNRSFYSLKF